MTGLSDNMEYRPLGRTGIKVSSLCLGTMTWGRQNTEAEGHEQMDYAVAQGINFFDTAEMYAVPPSAETYGRTEKIIGTWFSARKSRDKIILATKIAGPGLSWVRDRRATIDRENIVEAVESSLTRLQTDYIDLYQLHWPNRGSYHFSRQWHYEPSFDAKAETDNFLDVLQTLDQLIKQGKVRHAGLSNETAWGVGRYLEIAEREKLPRMVSIQNEYSLLCRLFETDLQEIALAEDIGLLAWSPLATGMLSGKYLDGGRPPGSRWSILPSRPARDTEQAQNAVRAYMKVAAKHGLEVCQMALAFVRQQPFVTSVIIGATSMEQLRTNIASAHLHLTKDVLDDIAAVRREYPMPY